MSITSLSVKTPIVHVFTLHGDIVPKARPRVTRYGTFMPESYANWKDGAILDFTTQARSMGLSTIERAEIEIIVTGKHSRRGDADNISGSILDALVQSGVLKGDSLMTVTKLSFELQWNKKHPPVAFVTLTTLK